MFGERDLIDKPPCTLQAIMHSQARLILVDHGILQQSFRLLRKVGMDLVDVSAVVAGSVEGVVAV